MYLIINLLSRIPSLNSLSQNHLIVDVTLNTNQTKPVVCYYISQLSISGICDCYSKKV